MRVFLRQLLIGLILILLSSGVARASQTTIIRARIAPVCIIEVTNGHISAIYRNSPDCSSSKLESPTILAEYQRINTKIPADARGKVYQQTSTLSILQSLLSSLMKSSILEA